MEEILRVDGGSAPEGTAETEEAVGLLEVFGLVCAFLAADAGCKAGNVRLEVFDKNKPANADALPVPLLVTVKFRGDIEDVTEAMKAAGASLCYVNAELIDENGLVVPDADVLLTAQVTGAAELLGFGSGNPITEENFSKGRFTSYQGRALAVLRAGREAGEAKVTVTGEGLGKAEVILPVEEK